MSVTLASQILSDLCLIPDLFAKTPDFYNNIYLFCFLCAGNICGRVLLERLQSIANDSAHLMRGNGR